MATLTPVSTFHTARKAVEQLDEVYRRFTLDDGGLALSSEVRIEPANLPWYWRRRPVLLPWPEDADQRTDPGDDETHTP